MKTEKAPEKSTSYQLHAGHRKRMQDRFLNKGIDSFESHEVLEMLLFFSIPRGDTNELAHRLMDQFGSLSGVFHAPYEELLNIKGVGRVSALLIKMIPQLCRVYYEDCHKEKVRVFEVEQAADIFRRKYIGRANEVVVLMLLDSQCRLILCDVVNEGAVNTVPVYVRRIVELAVRYNASAAILSHNHPSGNPVPSKGDIESTISVFHALKAVNVPLRDHIIFGDQDYLSLSHLGILKDIMEPF
ncbi:JAB domain-containing protein [Clostridium minihomine]|uniref:JAB domain-containing protein n=1 Tax=Clostridium minihomine TaxID=2045012 RepID=UPI000C77BA49|nr:DNA repair protein RadC [Clostridium minihomine]